MPRSKLRSLGVDLPLLPVTTVGAFPKPDGHKTEFPEETIRHWIHLQEEIDLDILTDGGMYHEDPIRWWQFAQSQTVRPVKALVTGPYALAAGSELPKGGDRRKIILNLAREIRKEIEALADAGARVIQINEPSFSFQKKEILLAREAHETCTRGLPPYFILHLCCGFAEPFSSEVFSLPFDNFSLELSQEAWLNDLPIPPSFSGDLTAGLIDVRRRRMEDLRTVRKRIEALADHIPTQRIWISPDCAFREHTEEEASKRLRLLKTAVEEVRQRPSRLLKHEVL